MNGCPATGCAMLSANSGEWTRRSFLAAAGSAGLALPLTAECRIRGAKHQRKALVAITLDLEMSRNFPTWEQTHWDYEKGNLDEPTKNYTAEACRRVKERGGVVHCFAVGRVCEQPDVSWLKAIADQGHAIGNHTYDHVNVKATRPEDLQYRFQRAAWLIDGQTPQDVIHQNIRMTTMALRSRVGIVNSGFRTPGGFANGLEDRPDIQRLLLAHGFHWVSSKYPSHTMGKPQTAPSHEVAETIVAAQAAAQPYVYPTGLVEVPMSPPSDIVAFRTGRWKLNSFLELIRRTLDWTIQNRAVYDFLGHPSCLVATDPRFQTIELICDMVDAAGDKAEIVNLDRIARQVPQKPDP